MRSAALLLLLGPGCGEDGPLLEDEIAVDVRFSLGDAERTCDEAPWVEALVARLEDPERGFPRAGFPVRAPCGPLSLQAAPGEHRLLLEARGTLESDEDALLFAGSTSVEAPGVVDLALRPEVAFFELDWNFGDRGLDPCSVEVAEVEVSVATVGGGTPAVGRYRCSDGPVRLDRPFVSAPHIVDVRALSEQSFPVYTRTSQRVLERGANRYTAVLAPVGGQVLLDWNFLAPGGTPLDACDDPDVAVERVGVSVQGLAEAEGGLRPDGSPPVTARLPCAAPRPVVFRPARFRAGRNLEVTVTGEGEHRFLGRQRFVMPEGDETVRLSLEPVGAATATVAVVSPGCEAGGIEVELSANGTRVARAPRAESGERLVFPDLLYGRYRVRLGPAPGRPGCRPVEFDREVGERDADWGRLEL